MTQAEFDFGSKGVHTNTVGQSSSRDADYGKNELPERIYKRTTTLTTDQSSYMEVAALQPGEERSIYCVNDIVSSAYGGASEEHHMIRRVDLMRSAMRGQFRKVKVRWDPDSCVRCLVTGLIGSVDSDGCTFRVRVCKDPDYLPKCKGDAA